ncbi:MAG: helicase HerA-like domain-containing protein [Candidatus Thorarchaeota archaeon]
MTDDKLWLGRYLDDEGQKTDRRFEISVDLLRRHGGVFGSTGSGKTVLSKAIIEEAALEGIPVLAFDPQGDIASLMLPGDPEELEEKGVPPERLEQYMEKVIVRVFTPASSKGLPVSINPLKLPDKKADQDDVIRLLDNSARTLVKVLAKVAGLSSSWEAKSFAAVYELLRAVWEDDEKEIGSLAELADMLEADKEEVGVDLNPYMKASQRQKLATSIRSLTVGSSQLLFKEAGQIDFDYMTKDVDGKTPINVLFLKTLRSEEEKHFFISIVLNQLYSWMLRQGYSEDPRMILFQDEAAPFIPAGMKSPGPKETFLLLFRQARKYGVECLIATQSPKDIDYKAFEQFNTIASGRISSKQSLKVLERILEPIAGERAAERIIDSLPGQQTANFVFSSADLRPKVNQIGVRWLLTKHVTLTEKDVERHMKELVERRKKILAKMEQERKKREEAKRKEAEKRRKERERQKELEEQRKKKQQEIAAKKAKLAKADDDEKVIETKGKTERVSYDDIINGLIARIEKVARTTHGLNFLRELIKRGELNYEKSLVYYLTETRSVIKHGFVRKEKKSVERHGGRMEPHIIFDFEQAVEKVAKSMGIKNPEYLDMERLENTFLHVVNTAKKNNMIERIALGKPFLEFEID